MAWVYRDAKRLGAEVKVRLENAADSEVDVFTVLYYGTGNPATDPAFTAQVQTAIAAALASNEQTRLTRLDETNRFRPPPG